MNEKNNKTIVIILIIIIVVLAILLIRSKSSSDRKPQVYDSGSAADLRVEIYGAESEEHAKALYEEMNNRHKYGMNGISEEQIRSINMQMVGPEPSPQEQ